MERHFSFSRNFSAAAAICLLALLVSCSHGSIGRRGEDPDPGGDNPQRGVQMSFKNSWTITYDGRYPVVDGDGLTYMVDGIVLNAGGDYEKYYLDVIKSSDYSSVYKSSPYNAAKAHLEALKKQGVALSSGNSTTYFDIGDEGGVDWIAIAFGVTNQGELSGSYQILNYSTFPIKAAESKDWELTYKGRELIIDQYGEEVFAEMISSVANTDESYTIDITYDDFIKNNFQGNLLEYFWYVSDFVAGQVPEGEEFSDYLYYGSKDVDFNRLKADSWTVYAIGMDAYGNPTGNYSKLDFNIIPENPTEGFNAWLGEWDITGMGYTLDADGNKSSTKTEITYRVKIESYDPNYDFLVSGWESSISSSNDLDFLAGYDKKTGQLFFYSQYIRSNSDDEGDYETLLLGEIRSGSQTYFLQDEGLRIARATLSEDGSEATVKGCEVTAIMDGDKEYKTDFILMQYYDLYLDSDKFYTYNDVPEFPCTMVKKSSGATTSLKAASAPAGRLATRGASVLRVSGGEGPVRGASLDRRTDNGGNLRNVETKSSSSGTKVARKAISSAKAGRR